MNKRRKSITHSILWLTCVCCLLTACSTTKLVPDDDQLFVGLTKIKYENYEPGTHFNETQEEIEAALATAPNGALFGSSYYRTPFPYGLWIWNYAYGSSGKFKQWLNNSFGKAPVLMSQVNPALRASVARSVLQKNGYMRGNVTYTEVAQRNPKKMKIGYTVTLDTLFTVDSIAYVNFPEHMQHLIDSTRAESVIDSGVPFSVGNLDAERQRITKLMRNNGYYYYQSGYASYLADTIGHPYKAQLRLQLADSLPEAVLKPWYMGRTTVNLRRTRREQLTDSMVGRRTTLYFNGKHPPILRRVIFSNMKLLPRRPFNYDNYYESMQKVNATSVFSSTDFVFTPRTDSDTLDLTLDCVLDKPYDFYVETSFVNRTVGRFGPEMKVGVTRRNAFRGAEKLDINLHGSYQWQHGGGDRTMNTYQYGADASIEFPRILFPKFRKTQRRPKRFYATPWTVAKVSTDIVHRPSYYKMHIVSGEWTYRWQPSYSHHHEFSPITLKYQYMNSHTQALEDLAILNPYLAVMMDDYFIPKMRYTYTYTSPANLQNPIRWETTVEESGNASSLYFLAKGKGWNEKNKTMFKNPYSQFVKIETDLTKSWRLSQHSQLVGHANAGFMLCYGNSRDKTFSESFYVGGANSIRAFTVRSIGPGGFPIMLDNSRDNRAFSYMIRNGNMKFVANLEYRSRLFGNLYGAIFFDMGNVWNTGDELKRMMDGEFTTENYDATEEQLQMAINWWNDASDKAQFHPSRMLNELATGTGIGLRYDLEFFVVRIDWGLGLHLPYKTSKSGYFNIPSFSDMHTLHLAIGYPF